MNISQTFEPESNVVQVSKIIIHPDWVSKINETFDHDANIAILILDRKVEMTNSLYPLCVPDEDDEDVEKVKNGLINVWRKNNTQLENSPRQFAVELIENDECFLRSYFAAILSSERTFCGQSNETIGTCNVNDKSRKDYVGAFAAKKDGFWYLRGLFSAFPFVYNDDLECDTSLQIYTNTLKYIKWIKEIADQENSILPQPNGKTEENCGAVKLLKLNGKKIKKL